MLFNNENKSIILISCNNKHHLYTIGITTAYKIYSKIYIRCIICTY